MIDELKNIIGFRLKEAMEVLNKYPKYRYKFEVTKDPREESRQITEEYRILRIKEYNGVVSILVCI